MSVWDGVGWGDYHDWVSVVVGCVLNVCVRVRVCVFGGEVNCRY